MDWAAYQADLATIWPEIILTLTLLLALVTDLLLRGREVRFTGWVALLGTLLALWYVFQGAEAAGEGNRAFGLLVNDPFAVFFKLLLGIGLVVVLVLSMFFRGLERDGVGEYYAIMLTAVLAGFLLVSTDHLLMLYLAVETLSIASYVLAGVLKREKRCAEAALKYLVYGALSSGAMVYGFSLLYGLTGHLQLGAIGEAVEGLLADGTRESSIGVAISLVLVLAGFGYKIAVFPFHFWAPDVYEGAPTPVTTFLAVVSKAASFGMLLRFFGALPVLEGQETTLILAQLLAIFAAMSMTFGNIAALLQDNAKRLLAYSAIAHTGYLLMGIAAMLTPGGLGMDDPLLGGRMTGGQAVAFYLAAYLLMNLGAFAVVLYLSNRFGIESIRAYRGLGWKVPIAGAMMTIFLLSLTGIPPTVGFIGKWYLFVAVINKGMLWLAVVAGLNSVISLFYYFRIVKALFFSPEEEARPSPRTGAHGPVLETLVVALGIAVVWFGIGFGALSELIRSVTI